MKIYPYPVVFFDLDETLINKDATSLWIRWRAKHERWALLEGLLAYLSLYRAYKKGTVTHASLSRYYRIRTRGMDRQQYQQRVQDFYAERGHLHVYPQAASLLFAYQRQGSHIVMITGADDIIADAYAKQLGVENVISNRLIEKDGEITGLEKPLCYGKGKIELAKRYLQDHRFNFSDTVFYSDSHSDVPLLETVKQPVVLNPNPALRLIAEQRQWPYLDWREP